ncbi:MAG: helix-turn-helix domain-containing protein [Methylobacter sp.]|nr:helix-turn-helix domain-containing protein [Methylobacter sp.]MDP2099697.1 helix-turn-helix domain-containing protein [Methylobacter sp.]MDP2430330.1 helix-turn-helix domain-containing protein [Methylobacter sp.]MDP3053499.1 helix-turn-helix domain-containing protein [Methylobacter sp.]MDP3362678.1 helix-turn-helix domain-containing protein [Methylobacter sp.]
MTITHTAQKLNVTRRTVSALVNGKTGVSLEMAFRRSGVCNPAPSVFVMPKRTLT